MPDALPPADLPITESDAEIARALESANLPTLMMSLVHLTGDASLLEGPHRPGPAALAAASDGIDAAGRSEILQQAAKALREYRDRGCTLPPPPSDETIRRMMSFQVGEHVPDEYVPMMLEEMALDGSDARAVAWPAGSAEARRGLHVVVIGAGMSGLLSAIRLQEAGIPYTLVEKNDAVGGTWYENRYPGCRVDVANAFYCYSFEPNHAWTQFFSERDEIHAYFERVSHKYGIHEKIRFQTEVRSAKWDEASCTWSVVLRSADGSEETLAASAVISAVGQLNRPNIPDVPGRERFDGPAFHSAQWPEGLDLTGKRVAVVGTGASAFQLVPEVAKTAKQLFVLQRSAPWMLPNPAYHKKVDAGTRWLLEHVPYYGRWFRFLRFWPGSDGLLPSLRVDPDWPHPERAVNAMNDQVRVSFIAYMRAQLGGDEELLAQVTPSYPPFGKRILQDNGSWLGALCRDNVELVSQGLREVTPGGVVCEDGRELDVDVIVYATGFHANKFLWPMEVVGRSGEALAEHWGDDPAAYLGITVPGYPNLFCLYGPATNLAHAGSIIFHSECQVRYVMASLRALCVDGHDALDCKPAVAEAYDARLQAEHRTLVWSHPGMDSWYKNASGRVTTTSPWRLVDYWGWTREPASEDYEWLDADPPR